MKRLREYLPVAQRTRARTAARSADDERVGILERRIAFLESHVLSLKEHIAFLEDKVALTAPPGPITTLPNEMLACIWQFLELPDLLACEVVCTQWRVCVGAWLGHVDVKPHRAQVTDAVVESLQRFTQLRTLVLDGCTEVTSASVSALAQSGCCPRLSLLDLYSCKVTDFRPLAALAALRTLRIGNHEALVDADLATLPAQITALTMEWCLGVVSPAAFGHLGHLTNLTDLAIAQNDNIPTEGLQLPVTLAPVLRRLSVTRHVNFLDECIAALAPFKELEELRLYWVPVTGQGFAALGGDTLPRLRKLVLKRLHILGPVGFRLIVRAFPNLKALTIRAAHQLDAEALSSIERLRALEKITLHTGRQLVDNEETGTTAFTFLASLPRLVSVKLRDANGLTAFAIQALVNGLSARTLKRVHITGARSLHPEDVVPLERLPNLESVEFTESPYLAEAGFHVTPRPDGSGVQVHIEAV
jgi:hypothetical protein